MNNIILYIGIVATVNILFFNYFDLFYSRIVSNFRVLNRVNVPQYGNKLIVSVDKLGRDKGRRDGSIFLPQYKFYTSLIESILLYSHNFGFSVKGIIDNIKAGISRDIKFERSVLREFKSAIFECLIIALFSWLFVIICYFELKVFPSIYIVLFVLFAQFLGVVVYLILLKKIRNIIFRGFNNVFNSFYTLQALSTVGLPIREIQSNANLKELFDLKIPKFKELLCRFSNLLESWKKSGMPIQTELNGFIDETWGLVRDSFEDFKVKQSAIRFVIIVLFYLTSYFILILSIFFSLL